MYLTYAEYLKWQHAYADARKPSDGLNIDAGGFEPWTDGIAYTGGSDDVPTGVMSEEDYNAVEFKARKRIDACTFGRVEKMKEVPEAVKYCMKALIKLEDRYGVEAQLENPLLSSFSTDGYSESYGNPTEQEAAANNAVKRVLKQYLANEKDDNGVPLLYKGVCRYQGL